VLAVAATAAASALASAYAYASNAASASACGCCFRNYVANGWQFAVAATAASTAASTVTPGLNADSTAAAPAGTAGA
jgi:hypothetical protein